jgi:hypothetical protein
MFYKTTRSLFRGKYQYKIVLVCPNSRIFRHRNPEYIQEFLEETKKSILSDKKVSYNYRDNKIRTPEDLKYVTDLHAQLCSMTDYDFRIEEPWVSIYTNSKKDIDAMVKLNKDKVKYISEPEVSTVLSTDTIIMPKMNYDYRVTLGKTMQPNQSFIEWAEQSEKCKLTKSCIRELGKSRSWGGTHFYVTGDNNLLLAKMHLGGCISKIERIVKA